MQPQILLLKEGTENAQGKQQVISNINACCAIVDAIRTTLGPRGMDKLIVDARGKATISNDGATIMKLLDVVHPAAKTLVDIAKSQVPLDTVYSWLKIFLIGMRAFYIWYPAGYRI
jgi:T-complex protein 1 subunit eta